jgi:hypothetical protein
MEAKFGPLKKTIDISREESFQMNSQVYSFLHKEWRNFESVEGRTSWRKTKKVQAKLATKCNKNEQQDAKNNAELSTKWTKTT